MEILAEGIRDITSNLYNDPTATEGYAHANRSPADNLGDGISLESGLTFDPEDKIVREEFAEQSDVNWLVKHYTGAPTLGRQARYDDIDYSVDLQTAMAAQEFLDNQKLEAPEELKEKYPDKWAILKAIASGEYQKDLQELEKTKAAERALETIKTTPEPEPPTKTQPPPKAPVTVLNEGQ